MNILVLTGRNDFQLAAATTFAITSARRLSAGLYVATGWDTPEQLAAMRLQKYHVELWRIGADDTRPDLDALVAAHITDAQIHAGMQSAIERALQQFLANAAAAATPPKQSTLETSQ